jgi:glycosyltransferase involved in cell wall biosynthesis
VKLVYEAPLFPGVGGGPRHFEGVAGALADLGVDTHLVLPSRTAVDVPRGASRQTRLRSPGNRAIRHVTYEVSRIALIVWWLISGTRVDVWMSRHSLFGVGTLLARRIAKVVVLEVNGPVREEVAANFGSPALARLVDRLFRWQIKCADVTIAVSPGLVDYVLTRQPNATCHAVPNGSKVANVKVSRQPLKIVYSGALTPWYDLTTLLMAVERLRSVHNIAATLDVVGDGNQALELRRFAGDHGLADIVRFTGWLPSSASQQYVHSAVVGVIPMGRAAMGRSPLKLYEYAAAGLAIVGSDVDGVSNSPLGAEVFQYEVGSVESLALALRQALMAGNRTYDAELWSWEARARQILSLVEHRTGHTEL